MSFNHLNVVGALVCALIAGCIVLVVRRQSKKLATPKVLERREQSSYICTTCDAKYQIAVKIRGSRFRCQRCLNLSLVPRDGV